MCSNKMQKFTDRFSFDFVKYFQEIFSNFQEKSFNQLVLFYINLDE